MKPCVKRAVVKLSGETLAGQLGRGIDFDMLDRVCRVLAQCAADGVELGVVVGAGNFWRGVKDGGGKLDRVRADHMGMLATTMNAIAIGDALERARAKPVVFSATPMPAYAETYSADRARRALSEGKIAVVGGGTGNPYVSTDTGVVLRALEMKAELTLMAKNVDGVYDSDPRTNPDAVKFDRLSYKRILADHLNAIDQSAAVMAGDNGLVIRLFALKEPESIREVLLGATPGTLLTAEE